MKQILNIKIKSIFSILLFLMLYSGAYAGFNITGADSTIKFSGKVFVLAVGINDYSHFFGKAAIMKYCESDANNFVNRVKKDSSFKDVQSFIITGKDATKESIKEAFKGISQLASPNDLFIFFNSTFGSEGSVILSDSSTISAVEMYSWSQSILTARQLFYMDICGGDNFICKLKKYILQNPNVSALCKQDRIVLSIGTAYETSKLSGGVLTMSYVRNCGVSLFKIFSDSNRCKIKFLYDLYYGDSLIKRQNEFEIEYFSEKDFYKSLIENDTKRTINLIPDDETEKDKNIIKKGETLCLIIGVKDYENVKPLNNTLNDAGEIKNVLSDKYNTKIIYLTNPTYDEFSLKLIQIQNDYKFEAGSQFILYAAAHGAKNELGEGCLLLKDSKIEKGILKNAFLLTSIKRFVGQLGCTNSLMLIDICHSGTMFDEENCVEPAAIEIPKNSQIFNEKLSPASAAYKNFLNQTTKIFIGSSNDQEAADGTGNHSPFAKVILDFLNGNTLPVIDSYYLQKSIEENIMKEGSISIPQFCMYGGCKKDGRFLFIKK